MLSYLAVAQDTLVKDQPLLRHEMTPEEYARRHEIGRGFVETDPPAAPVRNVAEFDRMQGALIRYPFGIPMSLIKEMATEVMVTTIVANQSQKTTVLNQYVANGVDTSHCNFILAPTDSYWTRDYGPWFETDSSKQVGIVDVPYNRPRPNDDEIPKLVAGMLGIPWFGMNVIATGGNYMCDGLGVGSSTDLVYVENPTQTPAQINEKMQNYLGIDTFQVVADPNISSTIDHIDCWSKFLAPDKILIRQTLPSDPEYSALEAAAAYWASQTCSYGYNYRVFRVKTPQDQPYTNSVILNNKVLVPFMNSAWDDSAKAVYEAAMPGYTIKGFIGQGSTPWISTDALHCRVMGIADIGMLYIKHIPISGVQPCETDYLVEAGIIASSHQAVKDDSVLIHYRVNGGPFQVSPMTFLSGDQYKGFIPKQPAGSVIDYYLSAADHSGRHETLPLIGAADPFSFSTTYTTLAPVPDTLWFITPEDCMYGKITQLTNYLTDYVTLLTVQQNGIYAPWYVDSMSVSSIPTIVFPGNNVALRVKMILPLSPYASPDFIVDSLKFTASSGNYHVIIMVNPDLLSGIGRRTSENSLGSAFPNPFSTTTQIPVFLGNRTQAKIEIVDMRGEIVATLLEGKEKEGKLVISWDGTDGQGHLVPNGIYICRLTTGEVTQIRKLVLLR
jgi:agmatine/peptidylarginine deiminase